MDSKNWSSLGVAVILGVMLITPVWAAVHYRAGHPWDGIAVTIATVLWVTYSIRTLSKR